MTTGERQALAGAGVAHLVLFAALSLGWTMSREPLVAPELSVPVEIVEIAPETRVTEQPRPSAAAAPRETAAPPPEPEPVPAPQPPEPTPIPDAVPPPEPAPPKPKPEPKPSPSKPTPPKPAAAKAAPKAPTERLDASELSSLIDKTLPKARTRPLDTSSLAKSIEQAIPKGARVDARATASLQAAIRAQVAPCWNPPIGGADVKKMTVVLRIGVAKDGSVLGRPEVLSQTGVTGQNGDYARAFAETARRAVLRCAPLKLPADMYDAWKTFELNFDPSEMT